MIEFQELRINPDCGNMVIDAVVPDRSYYRNVYIDKIVIDTQDTFVSSGPSSNPVYAFEVSDDPQVRDGEGNLVFTGNKDAVCVLDDYGNIMGAKHLRLVLDKTDVSVDFSDNIFFVYAVAKGTPAPDTPCGLDGAITLGVLANLYPIYQQSMYYIGELADTCSPPQDFIDYVLRLKALELSIKTGNYNQAITLWNKYFAGKGGVTSNKPKCGCHGTGS